MAWTYDGDPSLNTRDAVRYLVGDTNASDQLSSDEEIAYAITATSTTKAAAALVADAIAARLGRAAATEKQVGDLRLRLEAQAAEFRDVADRLRSEGGSAIRSPWFGGASRSDKDSANADTDRIPPYFSRGEMDNIATSSDI